MLTELPDNIPLKVLFSDKVQFIWFFSEEKHDIALTIFQAASDRVRVLGQKKRTMVHIVCIVQ